MLALGKVLGTDGCWVNASRHGWGADAPPGPPWCWAAAREPPWKEVWGAFASLHLGRELSPAGSVGRPRVGVQLLEQSGCVGARSGGPARGCFIAPD